MFTTHSFARVAAGTAGAAVFAAFCLTAAVAPAAASPTTVPVSRVVSYADLNLANPAGRAALETRIRAAARAVCKDEGYGVAARSRENSCIKTAISTASAN